MESLNYEFTSSQNALIKDLAQKMRFVSYFLIVIGSLLSLAGLFAIVGGGLPYLINGGIQLLLGIWTNRAAASFSQIVETQGNDVNNLMRALGELKKLYTLQFWLAILAIIFIVIALVGAIVYRSL